MFTTVIFSAITIVNETDSKDFGRGVGSDESVVEEGPLLCPNRD